VGRSQALQGGVGRFLARAPGREGGEQAAQTSGRCKPAQPPPAARCQVLSSSVHRGAAECAQTAPVLRPNASHGSAPLLPAGAAGQGQHAGRALARGRCAGGRTSWRPCGRLAAGAAGDGAARPARPRQSRRRARACGIRRARCMPGWACTLGWQTLHRAQGRPRPSAVLTSRSERTGVSDSGLGGCRRGARPLCLCRAAQRAAAPGAPRVGAAARGRRRAAAAAGAAGGGAALRGHPQVPGRARAGAGCAPGEGRARPPQGLDRALQAPCRGCGVPPARAHVCRTAELTHEVRAARTGATGVTRLCCMPC